MEERKMILQMLNEGKIDADEAVRLLEALGLSKKTAEDDLEDAVSALVEVQHSDHHYKGSKQDGKKKEYKEPSFASKISKVIDRVAQKVKEVDFDFNFGSYVLVQHVFQDQELKFDGLNVNIPNGKVQIKPWDEPGVRAECKAHVYKVESTEEARDKFIQAVKLEVRDKVLHFDVAEKQVKADVVLFLPKKLYDSADLQLGNGSIDVSEFPVDRFKGYTANGSVTLTNLSGKFLDVGTKNGSIDIIQTKWERAEVETWNGAIRVDGVINAIEAETLNGSITYELKESLSGKADLKTVTGKVNISLPEGMEVSGQLKTFAGGLDCKLSALEVIEERKDYAQKFMQFTANKGALSTYNVEAETKTGTITVGHTKG